MIEVNINSEIKDYHESFFFGLNLRQTCFSALALGAAVGVYFLCKGKVNSEFLSWLCILAAAPFAALGFVKFNGMPMEKLVVVWIKYILTPKRLMFKPTNLYMEVVADEVEKNIKEEVPYYGG